MRVTTVNPWTTWFEPGFTTSLLPAGTVGGVAVSGHTLLGVGAAAPIIPQINCQFKNMDM